MLWLRAGAESFSACSSTARGNSAARPRSSIALRARLDRSTEGVRSGESVIISFGGSIQQPVLHGGLVLRSDGMESRFQYPYLYMPHVFEVAPTGRSKCRGCSRV